MTSSKNIINQIEFFLLLRDADLLILGHLNMKKLHASLSSQPISVIYEIDKELSKLTDKLIDCATMINQLIKNYDMIIEKNNISLKMAEINHQELKTNLIMEIDTRTKISMEKYIKPFIPVDIDIIQTFSEKQMIVNEKIQKIKHGFIVKMAYSIRIKYLRDRITYMSTFSQLNNDTLDLCKKELSESENVLSTVMQAIIDCKNSFPDNVDREKIYLDTFEDYLEEESQYASIN